MEDGREAVPEGREPEDQDDEPASRLVMGVLNIVPFGLLLDFCLKEQTRRKSTSHELCIVLTDNDGGPGTMECHAHPD